MVANTGITAKVNRRTYLLIGLAVLLVIIVAAYLDGGEEPVRPIEQAVVVPPLTAQSAAADARGSMTDIAARTSR